MEALLYFGQSPNGLTFQQSFLAFDVSVMGFHHFVCEGSP